MKMRRIITLVSCIFIIGIAVGYLCVEWMCEPWIPMTQDMIAAQTRTTYDFRDTDAYTNLAEEDKMRLVATHHDFILLWGALDSQTFHIKVQMETAYILPEVYGYQVLIFT